MADIVISVCAKIGLCMVGPIGNQLRYLIYYNDNINGLRNQVAKLKILQADVQADVRAAQRNEDIVQTVQEWLRRVADVLEELEKFLDDEVKANQMCFGGGSCPDLKSRYKLSRKAKKKTLVVGELLRDGEFDRVSRPAPGSYINSLRNEVDKLKILQIDVQRLVQEAERNGEVILETVRDWLKRVVVVVEESVKFFNEQVKENEMCFNGASHPDLKSHVDELLRDGKFDKVSRHAPPPTIGSRIMVEDLMVFESRKSIFNSIMEELRNEKVDIIGVFGMGGVGKTTLVKEIVKQAEEDKLFDTIVMAAVSQTPDVRKIQGEIADILGLKFEEETEFGRAGRLSERIMKEKKILVILDDLWTRLDLGAIGIPSPKAHKGCKVLCTSRSQDVCSEMNTNVEFLIEVLSPTDSWNLFRRTAGDSVDSQDLLPIATKVSEECAGLPIAIVTVAMALKGKGIHIWSDALHQLKNSALINIKGMHKNVYSSLLLSYNYLESEEHRYIFLLCCLFPEDYDIPIENLVRYGKGLRLFQRVNKLKAARHRAHSLVDYLKTCCLLLDGKAKGFVKMHDIVRDFAISVVSKGQYEFLVRAAAGLEDWTELDTCGSHTAIGLWGNKFHDLPPGLDFPKLNLLMLGCDSESLKIPDTFFEHMKSLRVLDLRDMPILSLPPSIQCLKNLQTLCLENCRLRDISLIGELKDVLQILSFQNSDITELPTEIGQLSHLNLLDLTNCIQLTVIPAGVISSLSHLEDLYLMNSFESWGFEDPDTGRSNARLAELKHLSYLSSLEMHIPNVRLCPVDLLIENLIKFKISIAKKFGLYEKCPYQKTLKLELDQSITTYNGVNMLVESAEHLSLTNIKDLEDVLHDSKRKGFQSLKWLEVNFCDGIEYLVNSTELISSTLFPLLEKLKLQSMGNLKEIFGGPGQILLGNLRVVKVRHCGKLKNLFSQYTGRDFGKLKSLNIINCESLEEVIAHNREGVGTSMSEIVFPTLKSLDLRHLPNLTTFFRHENSSCSDDNGDIPTHPPLFNGKVLFSALEELTLYYLCKVKEIWYQQLLPDSFSRLRVLNINECHSLVIVFPYNLQQSLQNLEKLRVCFCDLVEVVCEVEGIFIEQICEGVPLPSLKELTLGYLPRLKVMNLCWNRGVHGFFNLQNLKSLNIFECNSLRNIFSSWATKYLIQLQDLEVSSCEMMEEIVIGERGEEEEAIDKIIFPQLGSLRLVNLQILTSFYKRNDTLETLANLNAIKQQPLFNEKLLLPNLQWLTLSGLDNVKEMGFHQLPPDYFCRLRSLSIEMFHNLITVIPSNLRQRLQNLEALSILSCDLVEEVWEDEGLLVSEGQEVVVIPRIKRLQLFELPKLLNMWWNKGRHGFLSLVNLDSLSIRNCNRLTNLFSTSALKGLRQLQFLDIYSCEMMKEIVAIEIGEEEGILELPSLKYLRIGCCPTMRTFVSYGCPEAENLKAINKGFEEKKYQEDNPIGIEQSPFFNEKILFQNLVDLRIYKCNSFRNLFSPSALKGLPQLYSLDINSCEMMKEIIATERGEEKATETVVVPQLISLRLISLPELACVSWGNFTFECPSLEILEIENCPNMRTFVCSGCIEAENLKAIDKGIEEKMEQEGNLVGITQESFFNNKVLLPTLENLKLCGLPSLKEIWPKQLPAESFCELKFLTVTKCDNLFRVFPCNLSLRLQKLKKLNVEECDSVEEVLEQGQYSGDKVVIYNMESLKLTNLPKLRNFYSGNHTLKFSSLEVVWLKDCPNMHTFSSGPIITPKLHMIKVNNHEKPLNGDLNNTIQQLFEVKEEKAGEERVTAQGIHGEILE